MATFNSTVDRSSAVHSVAEVPAQRGVARRHWLAVYIRRILLTDTLVVVVAVALAQWVRFGGPGTLVDSRTLSNVSYGLISVALVTSWLGMLAVFHVRSPRVVGSGPE